MLPVTSQSQAARKIAASAKSIGAPLSSYAAFLKSLSSSSLCGGQPGLDTLLQVRPKGSARPSCSRVDVEAWLAKRPLGSNWK